MRADTRQKFNQYKKTQCALNDVEDATDKFAITPSVQQTLEDKIQESSSFLNSINIFPVDELMGDKLGMGVNGPVASRTDTSGEGERKTKDVLSMTKQGYVLKQTDYDTHISYNTLDSWAKFKNFQTRLMNAINKRCALDRIMVGFNGTSAAATTDRAANPLLQDVNIGWLQHIREQAPNRVLSEGEAGGNILIGGQGADYKNLDALVFDATESLLASWYAEDPDLVVIVGRKLMHDKLFPLVNDQVAPTEKMAADIIISQARLGNLPAVRAPFFPPNGLLITRLDNLSIYYQSGGRRRAVQENPKKNRIETYESSNDGFVIEDFDCTALVENIQLQ